jgi:hypothetical protein
MLGVLLGLVFGSNSLVEPKSSGWHLAEGSNIEAARDLHMHVESGVRGQQGISMLGLWGMRRRLHRGECVQEPA